MVAVYLREANPRPEIIHHSLFCQHESRTLLHAMATGNDAGSRQPAGSKKPQDLTDHNCINLRLATYGGLYV